MPDSIDQSPAQIFVGFTAVMGGRQASGNVILTGAALPTTYDELHALSNLIAEHNGLTNIVVLSLCPLPAPRPAGNR